MTLSEGTTLSHYKVLEKIGQGGMGEVYRAEDTNLEREVAIKVLPEQFTSDPQRLARFEREAKLLAQLNHPNIAAIYGFEKAEGVHFLALELVPGETAQERVAKGPLPVEEALEVCRQIAEGVEAAHEKGVIHRDLKPANVKVTPEGKVKILDFGLAKAFEAETPVTDISQSPTLTEKMTRAGVILGTAAYMSPEQAKGEAVDKRADIFAFGCVLYELLTGKRTFGGKTITETLGAIIHKEPEWKALPASTPWRIQELLRRCLTKDVSDRLDGIGNVRTEIKLALKEPTSASPGGAGSSVQPALWKRAIPWSITVMVVLIAGIAIWSLTRPVLRPLTEFVITPPPTVGLANLPGNELAISPDGRRIVYLGGTRQLYVRFLDKLKATPIAGTEGVDRNFFFSPDGQSLVFGAGGKLKKVSLLAGAPITLCDAPFAEGGSWGPGDTIVFAADFSGSGGVGPPSGTGLHRVSANGGRPESLAIPDPDRGEEEYQHPQILPGGKAVLFDIFRGSIEDYQTAVLSLETGEQKILVEGGRNPRYAPTGHLVYELAETGTLMAVLFDLDSLEVTGGAVPILEGVRHARGQGDVDYSFSANGSLVYVVGGGMESTVVWVDREGSSEPLLDTPGAYWVPRLSPDDQRLAVADVDEGQDVWIYDLKRGVLSRLTFDPGEDLDPLWTPDGQRIVFRSNRSGAYNLYWKPADGSGETEQLTSSEHSQIPYSWTPDGKVLAFWETTPPQTNSDIWVLRLDGDRTPELFLRTPFREAEPSFSPDGRWIAYTSDESGRPEIYVRPFPASGGKWQISTGGGIAPQWAANGRELFYLNGDQMTVAPVTTGDSFQAGTPRSLFTHVRPGRVPQTYAVAHDAQRFVMLQPTEPEVEPQISVVLNWFEELKRLVPTN